MSDLNLEMWWCIKSAATGRFATQFPNGTGPLLVFWDHEDAERYAANLKESQPLLLWTCEPLDPTPPPVVKPQDWNGHTVTQMFVTRSPNERASATIEIRPTPSAEGDIFADKLSDGIRQFLLANHFRIGPLSGIRLGLTEDDTAASSTNQTNQEPM